MSETHHKTADEQHAAYARAEAWAADAQALGHTAEARETEALLQRARGGAQDARTEVRARFGGVLKFGTAGLRGEVAVGTLRMNDVVVARAAWGLGTYLRSGVDGALDATRAGVVVGFDGRRSSRAFAEVTAAVLAGHGIPVHLFDDPGPTPLTAFALRELGAAAGVMVTASHNPPADNGYKVYWATGGQIVPPHDTGIAAAIAACPPLSEIQRLTPPDAAQAGLRLTVDDRLTARYLERVTADSLHPGVGAEVPLRIVYTAMHGVGHRLVVRALRMAGFAGVAVVPSQADPDGAFPTVSFPNPEEDGAMDRALALAAEVGADLVLANDPDADRLAVALPDRDANGADGGGYTPSTRYTLLTGNEIGVLLGHDAVKHADTGDAPKLAITTMVSSTMLSRIARDHGARYAETLTGFKWIADAAIRGAQARGEAFVFGYEQALGYSVGPLVRDKDGVSAAVRFAELVAWLRGNGRTVREELDRIALRHGPSEGEEWSVRFDGIDAPQRMAGLMRALREAPPTALAGEAVVRRTDLATGQAWDASGVVTDIDGPRAELLRFDGAHGTRLVVRPSGTEPKVKFYLEAPGAADDLKSLAAERARLRDHLTAIRAQLEADLGLAAST